LHHDTGVSLKLPLLDASSAGPNLTGWLDVGGRKDAWCSLRKTSLVYFNKKDDQDPAGAITLDSLSTVVPPESTAQGSTGRRLTMAPKGVSFTLNTAKKQVGSGRGGGVGIFEILKEKMVWAHCLPWPLLLRHCGLRLQKLHNCQIAPRSPHQWVLRTKTLADANRWIAAIQDVIECCPRLTTKFEKYVNAVGCSGKRMG
jgi:hypothetical protein